MTSRFSPARKQPSNAPWNFRRRRLFDVSPSLRMAVTEEAAMGSRPEFFVILFAGVIAIYAAFLMVGAQPY
jgi:hypothetical protein